VSGYLELANHPLPAREQVDRLVGVSAASHGHLCPGQVIGVRMSILGLGLLGHACPAGVPEIKNLMGVVEIERCLADAVAAASGLRFGRGSLKLVDLGLLAATFVDLAQGRAVRVVSLDSARQLAARYAPDAGGAHQAQSRAYRVMPDHELFSAQEVEVDMARFLAPGARPPKVACAACGVMVRSGRSVGSAEGPLCPVCAGQAYFRPRGES